MEQKSDNAQTKSVNAGANMEQKSDNAQTKSVNAGANMEQKSDNAQTKNDNAGVSKQRKSSKWAEVLSFCAEPRSRYEILVHIGLKVHTDNFNQYVKPLIDSGQLTLLYPDKPTSPKQKYVVPSGKHI
jgi:ATP-dependent DNA helicase RecG